MSPRRRILFMVALVIAGEAAFGLPFLVARVFRPTVLDVFGITNLQLGSAFSLYGVVAMISYLPGGPLADRFPARWLLALGLISTAAGGAVYAQIPSLQNLTLLFGFWGVSSILVFWSALIRATKDWGGNARQGEAFGLLDGGRGLFAAVLASVTVATFAALLPADVESATLAQKTAALSQVIWIFTAMTGMAALLALIWVPDLNQGADADRASRPKVTAQDVIEVMRKPTLWLQALIVICAYVSYKGTDDFSLYARDGFGLNDVEAATVGTISFWVRPIAALAAGLIGDRLGLSRTTAWCFGSLIILDAIVASGVLRGSVPMVLFVMVATTSISIYGLRGLYFALFAESTVPARLTGTAVGIVSVVGYTPDIFFGPIMGYLTDRSPGPSGHEHLFATLAVFSAVGLTATLGFRRLASRSPAT